MLNLTNSLSRPFGWLQLIPRIERKTVVKKRAVAIITPTQPVFQIVVNTGAAECPSLELCGTLNRKSYLSLIEQAQELYENGVRQIQLDLSQLTRCELSGLFAIHSIIAIYRGAVPMDPEMGLSGYRSMIMKNIDAGISESITITRPSESARNLLNQAQLTDCLQIEQ